MNEIQFFVPRFQLEHFDLWNSEFSLKPACCVAFLTTQLKLRATEL